MLLSRIGSMSATGGLLANSSVEPTVSTNMVNLIVPSDTATSSTATYTEIENNGTDIISCGTYRVSPSLLETPGLMVLNDNGDITQNYFYKRTGSTTYGGFLAKPVLANNGSWYGFMGGGTTPTIVKFNNFGSIAFVKRISISRNTGIGSIGSYYATIDSNNNIYIIAGISSGRFDRVIVLVKLDSNANILWSREYDTGTDVTEPGDADIPWFLKTDSSNNVYLVGRSNSSKRSSVLLKVSSIGLVQFAVGLDDPASTNNATFNDLVIDGTDIYVVGNSSEVGVTYGLIAKYNTSGVLQWQKKLTNAALLEIEKTGSRFFFSGLDTDAFGNPILGEIDSNGNMIWQNKVNGYTNNLATEVAMNAGSLVSVDGELTLSSFSPITTAGATTTLTTLLKVPDTGTIPGSGTYGFFSNQFTVRYQVGQSTIGPNTLTPINITYSEKAPIVSMTDDTSLWTVTTSVVTNYRKYI